MNKSECVIRLEDFIHGLYESLDDPSNQQKQEYIDNINYHIHTFETALKIIKEDINYE